MERSKPIPADLPPVLHELVRRLVAAYDPEEIWLFGSWARGEASADSDLDLLLIVADDAETARADCDLAYDVLWGCGTAKDVVVVRRGEFEARLSVVMSLPWLVRSEGVCLYGEPRPARLGVPRVVAQGNR